MRVVRGALPEGTPATNTPTSITEIDSAGNKRLVITHADGSTSELLAVDGGMPKRKTRMGVMSEPPPIPVMPTRRPVKSPATVSFQSTSAPCARPESASADSGRAKTPEGARFAVAAAAPHLFLP